MDAKSRSTPGCPYEDFEPLSDWIREDGSDTLMLTLPGFKKEHLRVNLDNNRNLKISGERPLGNNRSSRFHREVQIPENCDDNDLRTMIENGTLHIKMPKTNPGVGVIEQTTPTKESPPSQNTSKTQDSEKDATDAHMKPTNSIIAGCSYEDFEPLSNWIREAEFDTLVLTLPGFKKEHLRVNLDKNRNLKISGERSLGNNRLSRFHREVQIPENCDVNDLRTMIENGTLHLKMPKTILGVGVIEQTTPTKESPPSQNTSKTQDSEKDATDAHMKPTNSITAGCPHEDFEPLSHWIREAEFDTLVLTLPGFKKEHLRVNLDNNRNLKISGERPLGNNRSSRFHWEVQIPENCDVNDLRTVIENGTLQIKMPKTIPGVVVIEQTTPTKESPPSQNTSNTQDSEKDATDAHMKPTNSIIAGCPHEDFEPLSHWIREAEFDTLVLTLPGFKKEHLRVNLDNNRNLKISGEHPLGNNRSSRFHREVQIPENCDVNDLRTMIENGTLHMKMPKTIRGVGVIEQTTPTKESPPSQNTSKTQDSKKDATDAHMKPTNAISAGRSYEDFEPLSHWIREAEFDTFVLTLPGFKKEHLKVNLDNNRNLKISGERPLGNNRSSRFHREVQIPENCDVNDLRTMIENGTLQIKMPKTIPGVVVIEQTTPTKESPPSQNTSKTQDSEKDATDAHMKPTNAITAGCSYEDFEPLSHWIREAEFDTFVLTLPGFKKEHLRFNLDKNRNLKISGERPLGNNRSSRFHREVQIPENCDVNDLRTMIENGTLQIKMPKTNPGVGVIEQTTPTKESPPSQNTSKTQDSEKDATDAHMKPTNSITAGCAYEDFEPLSNWIREAEFDTLVLTLPGFKKEHLRVNLDNNRNLKISGERPLGNNRSSRFHREVQIPENCDVNDLRTMIENGTLQIKMPKTIPGVVVIEQTTPIKESPPSQNTSKTQDSEKDATDAHMKPTNSITAGCPHEDFEPLSHWIREAEFDTFVLTLPGFKKEHLRVNLDNNRNLKISGERPLGNNRSSRFHREVQIPENCDVNDLRTMIENGTLQIKMPKTIPGVVVIEQTTPTKESPPSQNTSKTQDSKKDATDAHMKPTNAITAGCSYEDFEPLSHWIREAEFDTFVLTLPGFKKEHLSVNLDNNRNLKISGERPLGNNRSTRFHREVQILENCDVNDLRTVIENGTLQIKMPKTIPGVVVIEQTTPTKESPPCQNTSNTQDSEKDATDAHMKPTNSITAGCPHEDFEPFSHWIREAEFNTLVLTLPGFKKEHLRVNLDNNRNLKISGERPLGNNRSSRFHREVQIPENCDVNDLRTMIENGTLQIKMPKTIPGVVVIEQTTPTKESPPSQNTSNTQDSEKDATDAHMKPTNSITAGSPHEDFEPLSYWIREVEFDTLVLTLPGFKKEHLRVNLDNNRNLKISGERPLGNNRSSRFHREVQIPENCNVNDLRTMIENGTLQIKMPKTIPTVGVIEQTTPTKESPPSQNTSKTQDSEKDATDAHMKPTNSITAGCPHEDFEPLSDWITEAEFDTFVLTLPGFKKEHLRVNLDNNRNLKISGERPLGNNRSSRFHREVQIPENCDVNDLRTMIENGTLQIKMPKTIPGVVVIEQTTPTKESPPSQNTSKTQDSEKDATDAHMKPTNAITAGCSYEDFEPLSHWIREAEFDTFVLTLPGFKKEHLRVNLDNNRNLKISGERPLGNNRSSRFHREVQILENCDVNDLRTVIENGTLQIKMPKTIPGVVVIEQTRPTKESPPSQNTSNTQDSEKDATDAHMKPTNSIIAGCPHEDFEPLSHWIREAEFDTLVLTLPGFRKEHLRVNLDNNRNLKISGERPLGGNWSSRFHKEVQIPKNCDVNDLRARIENGTLYIKMPKTIPWKGVTEPTAPTKESPPCQDTSKTQDSEKDPTDAQMKPTFTTTREVTKKEAPSTDSEKQMKEEETKKKATIDETKKNEEETKKKAATDETKEKVEEEKIDETRKTSDGLIEM